MILLLLVDHVETWNLLQKKSCVDKMNKFRTKKARKLTIHEFL